MCFGSECVKTLLACTTDSSWFVGEAAISLAAKLFSSVADSRCSYGIDQLSSACDCAKQEIVSFVLEPLEDSGCQLVNSDTRLKVSLDVLTNVGDISPNHSGSFFHRLYDKLSKVADSQYTKDLTRLMLHVLTKLCKTPEIKEEMDANARSLVVKLLQADHISTAIEVSAWSLERYLSIQF